MAPNLIFLPVSNTSEYFWSSLMCGILVTIAKNKAELPSEHATALLKARGPDSFRTISVPLQTDGEQYVLTCCSSVLALRGDHIQEQPLVDDVTGSILCWNGEAWKHRDTLIEGNDSIVVFQTLLAAASSSKPTDAIVEALTCIAGPFAFVFFDARTATLYFGRDRLGRRSLIQQQYDTSFLSLCSVPYTTEHPLAEIDTAYVHTINVKNGMLDLQSLSWATSSLSTNRSLPDTTTPASCPQPEVVDRFLEHLSASVQLRVQNVPVHTALQPKPDSARIAVLFSGGLDCTLLARVAHDVLPTAQSIDLLNVAFENPRTMKAHKDSSTSAYELCPDRRTGRASFAELQRVCSDRKWRFVAVDVPYNYMLGHKAPIIELMKPHNTEMDLSIAMALYFAARGVGAAQVTTEPSTPTHTYVSTARVLLSGLGADELFGGYSRHAAAFNRAGYAGLAEELDLDYQRIGQRNLGRDDRVISCWGKETRYPFLDEDFVRFALDLPVWEKCGFRPEKLIPKHYEVTQQVTRPADLDPAKMLLRLAAWKLGIKGVATEQKRAIQFGARTAKMEAGGRKKGTDVLQ